MYGLPTKQGQYPWQVSLELLHPSFGFIGHWCGGVLIDKGKPFLFNFLFTTTFFLTNFIFHSMLESIILDWIISAAHCVHKYTFFFILFYSYFYVSIQPLLKNILKVKRFFFLSSNQFTSDLFNLPLPALWTIVLGEYDRGQESGEEQRISVDKIVLHEKYHNFRNDLGKCRAAKVCSLIFILLYVP
jgi:hypothetical protein